MKTHVFIYMHVIIWSFCFIVYDLQYIIC